MTFHFKSFMAIVLASQIVTTLANTEATLDLTNPVQEIKKQLPQELAEGVLLTDVNYNHNKQTLIYSATVIDTRPDQINQEHIVNKVCYTPLLRNAVEKNVTVSFFFYDERKKPLKHIVITEALCQSNFKTFERALTDNLEKIKPTMLPMSINGQLTLFNLTYQSPQKAIVVDLKAANNQVDISQVDKKKSIEIACKDDYLSLFTERNLNYIFNYYDDSGNKLIKTFNISANDCLPNASMNVLDKKLAEDAQKMKNNLKALSTDQIELIDVGYDNQQRVIWNRAIIKDATLTKDKINTTATIASLCTLASTRQIINKGITYNYSYYNIKKEPLISFSIDTNVCKRYDKENNILIQK